MAIQKPSIPKGTRDFSPLEMARRNYIFDTIRSVFRSFGFQQIETPAMENLSTLMGKYGEEGDKLLFRILNSGDAFADITPEQLGQGSKAISAKVCEKGLRYDLTVPFARFVVQHQNEISFPFKRFQIQPVWRADRPQKGRYREFYQCDVDVIGSRSQVNELELVQMVDSVFDKLGVRVAIHVSNRKLLTGFAQIAGAPDKVVDITVAIDKLDKIGLEKVEEEMASKDIPAKGIEVIREILSIQGSFADKVAAMRRLFQGGSASGVVSEEGLKGLEELEELFGLIEAAGVKAPVQLDLSLARGLNYYTGAIFEVKALDWEIGSICGGGRYDNLTGIFGLPDLSGVGISFGADRIYDVLCGLELFPESLQSGTTLLFAVMGADELRYVLPIASKLRSLGISVEVYPEAAKLRKQFEYADRKHIPFISICGSEEIASASVNIKNLQSGEQKAFPAAELEAICAFLSPEGK
ncbi:MAG: histidine--tRNA ligase [Bacteroidales bacterium]|nr:histidine--tRNA ligase [Bacteroidales bacterium]